MVQNRSGYWRWLLLALLQLLIVMLLLRNRRHNSRQSADDGELGASRSHNWNMIIFSQQWPITSCIDHKDKHHGATCNLYKNMTSWTVHGLWPTLSGTRGPTNCNSSWPFVEARVLDLEPLMLKYWANIYADTARLSLWQHEWSKHGTCAAQLPALSDEHKYFTQGLSWVQQYDLQRGLAQHGIVPSSSATYTNQQLFDAITALYSTDPVIDCIYDPENKRHLLSQIKLCFNRQLQLVSCSQLVAHSSRYSGRGSRLQTRGNCPEHGVHYPDTVRIGDTVFQYPGQSHQPSALDRGKTSVRNLQCSTPLCQALFAVYALNLTPL